MKPNKLSIAFGRMLRQTRARAGMTQERFSALSGIEQNHLSKLERGERLPSYRTMRRLAKVVPRADLLLL